MIFIDFGRQYPLHDFTFSLAERLKHRLKINSSYFYSVAAPKSNSNRGLIVATTVQAPVFLIIVLVILFKRRKRTPNLPIPVDIPLEVMETPQEPLPIHQVNFLWTYRLHSMGGNWIRARSTLR